MDAGVLILVVLGIAGIAVVAVLGWLAQERRREELAALSARLGWRFVPGSDYDHDAEYAHFEIFRRGHSRVARNTLQGDVRVGERPFPAKAGDFSYKVTSGSGKTRHTTTHVFSYLIVHLPYRQVPDLLIRPEGMFDKLAGAFGFDDIDFESEEFSRKFHVKSRDRKFAYDVLHPRMMELLMEHRVVIDIEEGRCCLSDGSRRWEPAEFERSIRFLDDFFELWPEYLTVALDDEGRHP